MVVVCMSEIIDAFEILNQVKLEITQPSRKQRKSSIVTELFYSKPTFQICFLNRCPDLHKCWNFRLLTPNPTSYNKIGNCEIWKQLYKPKPKYIQNNIPKVKSYLSFSNYEITLILTALSYFKDIFKNKEQIQQLIDKIKMCSSIVGSYEK